MTAAAEAGPGQSQEPGPPSGSPAWLAGVQVLEASAAAVPSPLAGSWEEVESSGLALEL